MLLYKEIEAHYYLDHFVHLQLDPPKNNDRMKHKNVAQFAEL